MRPTSSIPPFLRIPRARWRIGALTLVCAVLGVLYGILAPKWYRSVLTVMPAKSPRAGISSVLGGELGGLAAGLADSTLGTSTEAARVAAVLQSIGVTDAVIGRFDLFHRYGEKYQETTRAALWRHCEVKTLVKPGLVQLSCEDKDPRFVQQMLQFFAEYGNQVFRRVGVTSASEEVRYLEKHVGELTDQADEVAVRMREFQEKHQIVDLDTQSKAVVSALAALNSQRITKQLELEYARTFSSRGEATLRQLQSQLSVMDDKVRDLEQVSEAPPDPIEKRAKHGTDPNGMFPAALAIPKLRAELVKLYRDQKVSEASLVFALERLEAARANEARDVSTFLVLDPPALPSRHSRPKTSVSLLAGVLVGLALAVCIEWWRDGGAAALFGAGSSEERPQSRAV